MPLLFAALIGPFVFADDALKVKNAAEAMHASIAHLRGRDAGSLPGADARWQENTIYSDGARDMVTTSTQFTLGDWIVEVDQGLAPLRSTVYQVTVFSSAEGWHWKGSVKADGSVGEESLLTRVPDEDWKKITDEFLRKSKIPAPFGGYGH